MLYSAFGRRYAWYCSCVIVSRAIDIQGGSEVDAVFIVCVEAAHMHAAALKIMLTIIVHVLKVAHILIEI